MRTRLIMKGLRLHDAPCLRRSQAACRYLSGEQAARESAVEARSLYEKRKEAWSKSLVTSARSPSSQESESSGNKPGRPAKKGLSLTKAILDEEGELVFGFEEGEEILTLVEGEPVSIDDALQSSERHRVQICDTKTSQYIHIAEEAG